MGFSCKNLESKIDIDLCQLMTDTVSKPDNTLSKGDMFLILIFPH